MNRSTYQRDNGSSSSKAAAVAPQTHGTSDVLDVCARSQSSIPPQVYPHSSGKQHHNKPQTRSGVVRRVLPTLLVVAMAIHEKLGANPPPPTPTSRTSTAFTGVSCTTALGFIGVSRTGDASSVASSFARPDVTGLGRLRVRPR